MSVVDDLLAANAAWATGRPHADLPRPPARRLLVLTCMDARVDPLGALGLALGDAHIVRNAGAAATDDALASIRISHERLGTQDVVVVGHTDCAAHASEEDVARGAREAAARVAATLPLRTAALVLDVVTGRAHPA